MKTIIIYGSTYGYAKDCANKLSKQLNGDVLLIDISKDTIPSIDEFDNVVIGGAIYMGQISKKIKAYCVSNVELLKKKRVGLFLCSGLPQNYEINIKNAFPKELLKQAISVESFGGELRIEKMKFTHKILVGIMKKSAAKEEKALEKQMPENIAKMAVIFNK